LPGSTDPSCTKQVIALHNLIAADTLASRLLHS